MSNKKIIWSLFDSETAITKQLNNDNYEVYTIGLASSSSYTDDFINIDLSKRSCIKKLLKLPKPDIIFASPPCETWVRINIGSVRFFKRNFNEYNLYWQKDFRPNNFLKKHRDLRLLGQKTAYFTKKIIEIFKPELWCIENGESSLIFKYLHKYHKLNGYKNLLHYDSYSSDGFSQKPTYIFSNIKMGLKKNQKTGDCKNVIALRKRDRDKVRNSGIWKQKWFKSPSAYLKSIKNVSETYADRSRVPIELYQHILKIYEGKEQLQLFKF